MSLIESDPCQVNCTTCNLCDDMIAVKRTDLERILRIALCDDIREIVGKYLNEN